MAETSETPKCPKCGTPMKLRNGRNGLFFGCQKWPECNGTKDCPAGHPAREDYLRRLEEKTRSGQSMESGGSTHSSNMPSSTDQTQQEESQRLRPRGSDDSFWRDAFFEERRWWMRQQPSVTPGYTPELFREIATRECFCVSCGQPIPQTKQGSKNNVPQM